MNEGQADRGLWFVITACKASKSSVKFQSYPLEIELNGNTMTCDIFYSVPFQIPSHDDQEDKIEEREFTNKVSVSEHHIK
jgi:hypothetical protein